MAASFASLMLFVESPCTTIASFQEITSCLTILPTRAWPRWRSKSRTADLKEEIVLGAGERSRST